MLKNDRKAYNYIIDMDKSPFFENYKMLIEYIFGSDFFNDKLKNNEVIIFSSNTILYTLYSDIRNGTYLALKYGLYDGKNFSNSQIAANEMCTSSNISRKIREAKSNVLLYSIVHNIKPFTISELKNQPFITDEEREILTNLEKEIVNSKSYDDVNFNIIGEIQANINNRISALKEEEWAEIDKKEEERLEEKKLPEEIGTIEIRDLGFNTRIYNALKRSGRIRLADFTYDTMQDLKKIRNLGDKNIPEVIKCLKEYGINFEMEDENVRYESKYNYFLIISDEQAVRKRLERYTSNGNSNEMSAPKAENSDEKTIEEVNGLKNILEKSKAEKKRLEARLDSLQSKVNEAKGLLEKYNRVIDIIEHEINEDNKDNYFNDEPCF